MADNPSGAIGEDKHSQARATSATAPAPSAELVAGSEANNQLADAITNKQPRHDVVETTQATDKAAPSASGDKSTSVSDEVDATPTQETSPAKAVPELELGEDPTPRPSSADAPPPLPEKDTAVTINPTPTSEETSAPPSQTAEPAATKVEDANKTDGPSAQSTEPEAPATENAESSKLDAIEESPKPQSGADGDNRAVDEGSAAQDGEGKAEGVAKLTLLTERVRELSTASIMSASSSTPGTPAEEVASSAVDEGEGGVPEQGGTLSKSQKKKLRKKKNKGEKNSPRPPSGETVHNADDSTIQDRNPPVVAATPPVDIPNGEGEGELVEKVASGEEDAPVMVDKPDSSGEDSAVKVDMPQADSEARKTVDGDSGTDDWDW